MFDLLSKLPPEVQAAYISAVSTLVATLVGSLSAFFVSRQILSRKKLAEQLHQAMSDIEFLLAVEKEHCEHHRTFADRSFKNTMRDRARELGHTWSSRFEPAKIERLRDKMPPKDSLKDAE